MNNIYYDGNLKASLTVGSVSDINPLNAYTKDQVNELLGEKSDANHTHEQYLTEHQSLEHLALKEHTHEQYLTEHQDISHLASTSYVDDAIDNIDIPEVDLSNCATKEELNEVKQSVSEGKKLIASAITDMGIDTLATDTWETMVENILNINPYYIEYTVIPSGKSDILDNYKYIPNIKNIGDADFHKNYDGVRITLKDGSITKDLNTLATDVEKIRIYYNARTEQLKFRGSLYGIVYIKTVDYLKTDNFTSLGNMFQGCRYLETINTNEWVINSSVTNLSAIFYGCNALKKLDLSNWNTANIKTPSFMLSGVPIDVNWCYDPEDPNSYANWTLTEEQTGFSGIFPWNKSAEPDSPYYIEYTFSHNDPSPLLYETSAGHNKPYYINIPKIYDADSNESYNYEFVKITLNEGEVINAASLDTICDEYGDIYTDEVACIRIYYPEETSQLRFFNPGELVNTCRMRTLEYINVKNFTSYENMFYKCSYLEHIVPDMNIWDWNKKIDDMFFECSSLTTLDLSYINTDYIISCYGMLNGVPQDLDWCYDGSNYENWTLTEEQTSFRGIFPWTKRISKTIMSNRMNYGEEITVLGNGGISITSGRIGYEIEETEGGFIIEIPEFINRLSVECTSMNLMYNYILIFDSEDHIIYLDDTYDASYTTNPFYQYDGSPSEWADSQISQVIYRIAKEDIPLSEKYKGEFGDYYYALPYIPDFEYKLDSGDIEMWILNTLGDWGIISNSNELSNYVCTGIECIGIIDRYSGNLNGLRFGNDYTNDACSIISSLLYLNVPEVDDNIFACCQQLETINLSPEGSFKPEFTKNNPLNLSYCEQLKVVNLGLDPIVVADAFKGTYENLVIFTADKGTLSDCGTFTGAAVTLQYIDSDKNNG